MVLFSITANSQQKVQFTQYMFDGMVINPAYAGADGALSLTLISRDQWAGVEGAPNSQTLSGHTLFKKNNVGVGFSLNNDVIGVHRTFNFSTNYAYHLPIDNLSFLSFGLQAGLYNHRSDYSSLADEMNNDPLLSVGDISHTFFNVGTGLYFRSPNLHIGYSIPEMLPEKITFNDSISVKFKEINHFIFSKYRYYLNENIDLEPSLLIKYIHGLPVSYDINFNATYRRVLTGGISYRRRESIDFLLKCQLTPQLQFGYSYDYPINQISVLSNSSHEVLVKYIFNFKQTNVVSPR